MAEFSEQLLFALRNGENNNARQIIEEEDLALVQNAQGWSLLHYCGAFNNQEMCLYLLAQGANVNSLDQEGWTPLMVSVAANSAECVSALLDAGADFNVLNLAGESVLNMTFAAEGPALQIVVIVLNEIVRRSATVEHAAATMIANGCALHHAAWLGNAAVVGFMLAHGVPIDTRDPNTGMSAAHVASHLGDVPSLQALLAHHPDVVHSQDFTGLGLLHYTYIVPRMDIQYVEAVRILLEAGATTLTLTPAGAFQCHSVLQNGSAPAVELVLGMTPLLLWDAPDNLGNSFAHYLAANPEPHAVTLLAAYQDSFIVDAQNARGQTPLAWAARHGCAHTLEHLLGRGATPDLECERGFTPLMTIIALPRESVVNTHVQCVEMLLQSGADPQHVDGDGVTLFDVPLHIRHLDLMRPIIAHLALVQRTAPNTLTQNALRSIVDDPDTGHYWQQCQHLFGQIMVRDLTALDLLDERRITKVARRSRGQDFVEQLQAANQQYGLAHHFRLLWRKMQTNVARLPALILHQDRAAVVLRRIFTRVTNRKTTPDVLHIVEYLDEASMQLLDRFH